MREFNTLTGFLASKISNPTTDDTVRVTGYDNIFDGGKGDWKHNGVTGQTPSQSPGQLGSALANILDGNQYALIGNTVNVLALGAKGDGATDDILALIAAVASSTSIELPKLVFKVTTPLLITTNNTTIFGGGELNGGGGGYPDGSGIIEIQADNVTVNDLTLDSNNTHSTGRNIKITESTNTKINRVNGLGANSSFIYIGDNAVDTYIEYCTSKRGYGVLVDDPTGSSGLFTKNNIFDGGTFNGDGIEVNAPTNGFSRFRSTDDTMTNCNGVAVNQGLGIGLANCSDWQITNPTVTKCESDGLHFEDRSNKGIVLGGLVEEVNTNGAVGSGGVLITNCNDVTVDGTQVKDVQNKSGVSVALTNATPCERIKILNMNIDTVSENGIRLASTIDSMVRGNTIISANGAASTHNGILVTTGNEGLSVDFNKIADGTTTVNRGINIGASSWDGGSLQGNEVYECANNLITDNGGNVFNNSENLKSKVDRLTGRFTPGAAATVTVVVNGNSNTREEDIRIFPLNASAAALTGMFVAVSITTQFTVNHASAVGDEVFGYYIST